MTTAADLSPRQRRYDSGAVARTVELRAAGWDLGEIQDRLELERGVRPSRETLAIWTNPTRAASKAASVKRVNRRRWNARITGRMPSTANLTSDFRLIRARALREAGLSANAVARVMTFDFPGSPVTEQQVRYACDVGRWPEREAAA